MHQGPYSRSTTFFQRPRGATVARLTADQKVAWSNHFGVRWSLIGMKCLIWKTPFSLQDRFGFLYTGFFLSGDTKSEENGNVNAKVKTNLLRARNWTSDLRIANISSTVLRSTNWAIEGLDATKHTKKFRKPDLLGFLREIRLRFVVNASRPLHRKHHLSFLDLVAQR